MLNLKRRPALLPQGINKVKSNLPASWHQTRQRHIKTGLVFREETLLSRSRSFSAEQLSGALIQAAWLWAHFTNTAEKPWASAGRLQHILCLAWLLSSSAQAQIAPGFTQQHWLISCSPKNLPCYKPPYLLLGVPQLWVYHMEQNSIPVCLWLRRQRPDPVTGQRWGVKKDGRSWGRHMCWPGAIDSYPSHSTTRWQGSATLKFSDGI